MHDFLVCCTVLCTQRFAVVRPRCANESYVSRIYFSATCNIKETKTGKKVRHQSKTNIFARLRSVRVLSLHVDLPEGNCKDSHESP